MVNYYALTVASVGSSLGNGTVTAGKYFGTGACSDVYTGMELLYGCEENSLPAELLKDFLHHTLKQEKECFCTSCGRSCGECPGKF